MTCAPYRFSPLRLMMPYRILQEDSSDQTHQAVKIVQTTTPGLRGRLLIRRVHMRMSLLKMECLLGHKHLLSAMPQQSWLNLPNSFRFTSSATTRNDAPFNGRVW